MFNTIMIWFLCVFIFIQPHFKRNTDGPSIFVTATLESRFVDVPHPVHSIKWLCVKSNLMRIGRNPQPNFTATRRILSWVKFRSFPHQLFMRCWRENWWIHAFPWVLEQSEMQTTSSKILTRVADSLSYHENRNAKYAQLIFVCKIFFFYF